MICVTCGRGMRPRHTHAADYPGLTTPGARRMCFTCYTHDKGGNTGVEAVPQSVVDRARILAAEGMPWNWIAEDVGVTVYRLRALVGHQSQDAVVAWRSTWVQLTRHDELMRLHREFAPRSAA